MKRITPAMITSLNDNEVFVFGSNLSGKHGRGAARMAMNWGAVRGLAEGMQGQTYAIPTKDRSVIRTLPIEEIQPYVDRFIDYAMQNPQHTYLVTEIGCGLAGLSPEAVAPLFDRIRDMDNVYLPERFWEVIER